MPLHLIKLCVGCDTVEELLKLEPPFEAGMLESLVAKPENFYSPAVVRANRGFIKGQIPRERIVKEFGEAAFTVLSKAIKAAMSGYPP